jgi:hypothetical protein
MNRDKMLELKKFLEDEISKKKRELEYLEFLLAYIEGALGKAPERDAAMKEENIMEVRSGKETIALILRTANGIKARLLFEVKNSPEILSEVKRQVEIIDENARVSVAEDKNYIREITVESKSLTPVIMSGIAEALKLLTLDIYNRKGTRSVA